MIFRNCACRGRNLTDRNDRLARAAIKHIDITLLGRPNQRGNTVDVKKDRLGWNIHIPKVVMHCLAHPFDLPRIHIECDDGRGIFFDILATAHTELIRHLIAERDINKVELVINAEDRPAVRRIGRVVLTFGQRRRNVRIARIPVPKQLTRADIERADNTRLFFSRIVVIDRTADDNLVADDCRWRGRVIIARRVIFHPMAEIERTTIGKVSAYFAGSSIKRDQTGIRSRQINALRAFSTSTRGCILPVAYATAGLMLTVCIETNLRVELPLFLARSRIKRNRPIMRRAKEKRVANFERCHLIGGFTHILWLLHIAGLILPGDLKLGDIFRRYLSKRRIALSVRRPPILMPLAIRHIATKIRRCSDLFRRQVALDVGRVLRHRIARHNERCERRNGQWQSPAIKRFPDPWCQQPQAKQHNDAAGGTQSPPIKADFINGPAKRSENDQRINPERQSISFEKEEACQQKTDSDDDEGPAATQRGEINPGYTERKTNQYQYNRRKRNKQDITPFK
ncbi:hypothetical protein D3C80_183390 [compost metagenome]